MGWLGWTRSQCNTLGVLYLCMMVIGVHRVSVSLIAPGLVESAELPGWTHATLGNLMAFSNLGAPPGKLVFGYLSTVLSGRAMMLLVLPLAMGSMLVCGYASSPTTISAAYLFWRFVQTGAFPACARILVDDFDGHALPEAFAFITVAMDVGNFLAGFLIPVAMGRWGWRYGFFAACWVGLPVLFILNPFRERRRGSSSLDSLSVKPFGRDAHHPLHDAGLGAALKYVFSSRSFYLMNAIIILLAIANEFLSALVPQFTVDVFQVTAETAGFTYAILPLGAAGGTVLLGVLHGRWGEARMQRLYAWLVLLSALVLVPIGAYVQQMGHGSFTQRLSPSLASSPITAAVVCGALSVINMCVGPVYSLPGQIYAMRLGGRVYCGLVMSLVDTLDYVSCAAFMVWVGQSTATHHWGEVVLLVDAGLLVAAGCFGLLVLDTESAERNDPIKAV